MNHIARFLIVALLPSFAIPSEKIDWGIDVESKRHTFAMNVADINQLDLANMNAFYLVEGKTEERLLLRRGKANRIYYFVDDNSVSGSTKVTFRWKKPLDEQRFLAYYEWGWYAGGSDQGGIIQVFEISEAKVSITQQIYFNMHAGARAVGAIFDANAQTLTVKSVPFFSPGGRCCPSHLNTITFRWDGQRFVRVGAKLAPIPKHD
jgi:hypothetical protein